MNQPDSGPTCVLSADDPEVQRARAETIVALRNTSTGEDFPLHPDARRWVLGSRRSCDFVVRDAWVSGAHAVIERRLADGSIVIRDKSSRNGTVVNGTAIEAAVLRPGALVAIGKTTLVAVADVARHRRSTYEQLRGNDPRFRAAVNQALRAAATDCSILIVGETGTGKDLLARLVHEASPRSHCPYIAVNCGAIPRELIGSELFGHERGSFTGAVGERDGYFVEAAGGTLFLDEIAELPLEQQPHLLRAIENRRVRRVGGALERQVDCRIVSATNRLEGLGTPHSRLRLDVFHRIATVIISLPPLRERIGDVRELVTGLIHELAPQYGRKEVSAGAWAALVSYDWPGNVRELVHAVSRAMALGGPLLGPFDFLPDLPGMRATRTIRTTSNKQPPAVDTPASAAPPPTRAGDTEPPLPAYLQAAPLTSLPVYTQLLRDAMIDALARHGSIRRAARHLGMPKSTFADKARAWGLLDESGK
jgi:DNA-binding NtrC family response regulator